MPLVSGDDASVLRSIRSNDNAVKRLAPAVVSELKLKNKARTDCGLSPIRVKVRSCMSCGGLFESMGNRTCGCRTGSSVEGV